MILLALQGLPGLLWKHPKQEAKEKKERERMEKKEKEILEKEEKEKALNSVETGNQITTVSNNWNIWKLEHIYRHILCLTINRARDE